MKKVHPDVLHLVLNSITPAVGKHIDSASPLLSPLSLFYYDLLLCQWRMLVNDDSPSPQMGVVLETFLPILSSSDIASTKKGCELLLKLNEKRRLFSQKFFLSGFREQYLRVVMTILLKMTHDLLRFAFVFVFVFLLLSSFPFLPILSTEKTSSPSSSPSQPPTGLPSTPNSSPALLTKIVKAEILPLFLSPKNKTSILSV